MFAQQTMGVSVGYEFIPFPEFADPETPFKDALEIRLQTLNVGASFPLVFADGKTMLLNQINYQRLMFEYKNWDVAQGGEQIDQADFTFEAVLGVIRIFSEKFSFGGGVAYIRDFGDPFPLPFLLFEWNITPKLSASELIPMNLDITYITYKLSPMIDLGLLASLDSNRYHGDPDKFGIDNPQMKYSIGTAGPKAQIHFTKWLHLNFEGGWAFYRNFEFFDGDDEVRSMDMKQNVYVRSGLRG